MYTWKHAARLALPTLLALSILWPGAAPAQTITGSIAGHVTDESGGSLPGTAVRAVETRTGAVRTVTTDDKGQYVFPVLPVGVYRVEIELPGFKTFVRDGIVLTVNRNARADARLALGAVTEQVVVGGDAPMVDTRQVQVGGLVDSRRINDLPLNGRNVYDLLTLLPGVTEASTTGAEPTDGGNTLRVNGSRTRFSTFLLDGNFNNNLYRNSGNEAPNPDAVEEFRVLTSNFSAEFGRSPGAVINVVTKSGTNMLKGSLFEFVRDDALNARKFFEPDVAELKQHQYGGSIGGPIMPGKLFFFGSYQGLYRRSRVYENRPLTPTAAERQGDFSSQPASRWPIDPLTGQAFSGGRIPQDRLDPVAQAILQHVPLPKTADGRYEAWAPVSSDSDQGIVKVDWQARPAHKVYGNVFMLKSPKYQPFRNGSQLETFGGGWETLSQYNVVANEDWTIGRHLLNQFRSGFTRRFADATADFDQTWPNWGSRMAVGSGFRAPPIIAISGRLTMAAPYITQFENQSINVSDTLTWARPRHTFKVGTWLLWNRYNEVGGWLSGGNLTFDGSFTRNALGDFLLGRAARLRQNNGVDFHFRSLNWHNFVQDDWQIHPRVTLNLGVRYELNTPYVSDTDYTSTFRFDQQSTVVPGAPRGLVYPGDAGVPRGLVDTDRNNVAPRIGVAYDVFGDGRTAVRAGYGVFYSADFANTFTSQVQQPFLVDLTIFGTPSLVDPYGNQPGGSPFPYTFDPQQARYATPITAVYMNENLATPYLQHYSFAVEQQLWKDLALTVTYVGNTARKLLISRDANEPVYVPGKSTPQNVNERRPYMAGTYGAISEVESGSTAHYDSLQVSLNKRFSRGFSVLGSYTLGKSIDEASDDRFTIATMAQTDSFDRRYDRGRSDADVRHILTVSYLWELPGTPRLGWIGRGVLSGWQLNGIVRARSGYPINVVSGVDTNVNGRPGDRPNLAGDPVIHGDRSQTERLLRYFDPTAFERPETGAKGNAGRNMLTGPGALVWDASLFKAFRVASRHQVQLRIEAFSVLNQPNFGLPNANINSGNVGRILTASGERIFQLGVKYAF